MLRSSLLTLSFIFYCLQNLAMVRPKSSIVFRSKNYTEPNIQRIIGGQVCHPLEFPWMASLQNNGKHYCGATLLNREWLLTAAHCVDQRTPRPMKVVLGAHNIRMRNGTERTFDMKLIIVHEMWNSEQISDDIALIKLDRKVDFSGSDRHIKPIDLPEKNFTIDAGQECVATGWGITRANSHIVSDFPLKVSLPIVAQTVCVQNYSQDIAIRSGNICAGGAKGRGICNGDSGGPLQCFINQKWKYVGLDSFTAVCALENYPSVFTRITYYWDWISDQMNKN